MSQKEVLKSLEAVLESFLERVVAVKQPRLQVLEGINRLDDIARSSSPGSEITDRIGEWFADNNKLLQEKHLRGGDINRIGHILEEIRARLELTEDAPPAMHKIASEIDRWKSSPGRTADSREKIVLRRGPETTPARPTVKPEETDSIERFRAEFDRCRALFEDFAGNKKHLLSVLDEALTSATVQKNRDALILSAFMIYFLKLNSYKVEPFVKRLKQAEQLVKGIV